MSRVCQWFVETKNTLTSRAVVALLGQRADEAKEEPILDTNGKEHRAYRCPFSIISALHSDKREGLFEFRVFRRQCNDGPVKPFTFLPRSRRRWKPAIKKGVGR